MLYMLCGPGFYRNLSPYQLSIAPRSVPVNQEEFILHSSWKHLLHWAPQLGWIRLDKVESMRYKFENNQETKDAAVAQSVEQRTENPRVDSSILSGGTFLGPCVMQGLFLCTPPVAPRRAHQKKGCPAKAPLHVKSCQNKMRATPCRPAELRLVVFGLSLSQDCLGRREPGNRHPVR